MIHKFNTSLFRKMLNFCLANLLTASLLSSQILFTVIATSSSAYALTPNGNVVDLEHIVPDGTTNTITDITENGTPLVYLAAPSGAGVSLNNVDKFSVYEDNAILDNYKGIEVYTDLGGKVQGNPNFNPVGVNEANTIVMQTTGVNRTYLYGALEIAGKRAELIIANPNGISASGAGFLNTSKLTMITGTTNMAADGSINNFDLATALGSDIIISGVNTPTYANLGLDVTTVDYVDIVSRMVQVTGDIRASNELNIRTGNKQFDYNTKEVTSDSSITSDKPAFSIDSSYLGGMYAGKIGIIATENGVGVRTRGDLVSNAEDINFDVMGDVEYERISSERDITITSREGNITQGKYETAERPALSYAKRDVNLTANTGDIELNGAYVYAANNVTIDAGRDITNNTSIQAYVNAILDSGRNTINTNEIIANSSVIINSNYNFLNSGDITSYDYLEINAANNFDNSGILTADGNVILTADNIFTDTNEINSGSSLSITSQNGLIYNDLYADGSVVLLNEISGDITQNYNLYSGSYATLTNNGGSVVLNGNSLSTSTYVTINASQDITNNTSILAYTNATLTAGGSISSTDEILANGDVVINSGYDFTNSGTVSSGNYLEINADNNFNNSGILTSNGSVVLTSGNIFTDTNEISSGNNLSITSQNGLTYNDLYASNNIYLLNQNSGNIIQNKMLYAGNDVSIINNGGNITFNGDYVFAGDNTVDTGINGIYLKALSAILNYTEITSLNDIVTESTDFTNEGTVAAFNELQMTVSNDLTNQNGGLLFSSGDMNLIVGNTLTNNQSEIFSLYGDININTAITATNSVENIGGRIEANVGDVNIKAYTINNLGIDNKDVVNNPESAVSRVEYRGIASASYNTVLWGYDEVTSILESEEAYILAGNNIDLEANTIVNRSSWITAANNINIDTINLYNTRTQFTVAVPYIYETHWETCWSGLFGGIFCSDHRSQSTTWQNELLYSNTPAIISAGNYLNIDAVNKIEIDTPTEQNANLPIPPEGTSGSVSDTVTTDGATGATSPTITSGGVTVTSPTITVNGFTINLPTSSGGLFGPADPTSDYLFETNLDFLNPYRLTGSAYFQYRMGYDPNMDTTKWLGDPFYEWRVIQDQIREATYKQYQWASMNWEDNLASLIDNAYDVSSSLQLTPGIALTSEQLQQLDRDIIWYVMKDIDGQDVLVPTVYFANNSIANYSINDGSMILGSIVDIKGNNINNQGNIIAEDTLVMQASNDIVNRGGNIYGENAVVLRADNNIVNETIINRVNIREDIFSEVARTGNINSGNILDMRADNNINLIAGNIGAEGNATIVAGNDINLLNGVVENKRVARGAQNYSIDDTITNVVNNISTGGDLILAADNDINSLGTKYDVGNDMYVQADNNYNEIAVQNSEYHESHSEKSGFMSSSVDHVIDSKVRNQQSELNVGNNLNIMTGGDTTLVAADLNVGNNATITAGNYYDENGVLQFNTDAKVNILNAMDSDYHYEMHQKESMNVGAIIASVAVGAVTGGVGLVAGMYLASQAKDSSSDVSESYNETVVASTINANNILIKSASDTNIIGSDLTSLGDTTIIAGNYYDENGNLQVNNNANVNILNAYENDHTYELHEKSGFGFNDLGEIAKGAVGGAVFGVGAGVGMAASALKYESTTNMNENSKRTVVASNINSQGDINIMSGADSTILGSNLTALGDINITAGSLMNSTGDIVSNDNAKVTIASANNFESNRSESNTTTIGMEFDTKGFNFMNYLDETKTDVQTTNVASNIEAGNAININTQSDLAIEGSNLVASTGDIVLNSEQGNVMIVSGKNYENHEVEKTEGSMGLHIDHNLKTTSGEFLMEESVKGQRTHVASNIVAEEGGVIINSGEDTLVLASDIEARNGVLVTTGGDLGIINGFDESWNSNSRKEGESYVKWTVDSNEISVKGGIKYEQERNSNRKTTVAASNISSSEGSVIADSEDNITVSASNIVAQQDIDLTAKNNLSILSASEAETNKNSLFMIDAGVRVGIDHNIGNIVDNYQSLFSIDLADTLMTPINMTKSVIDSTMDINEQLLDGELLVLPVDMDTVDEALSGNEDGINGLNTINQVKNSSGSGSAAISINIEMEGSTHKDSSTTSVGSMLAAGNNIGLTTEEGDVDIEGSYLDAGNNVNLDSANDINITSSENTYKSKDLSANLEIDVDIYGTKGPGATDVSGGISTSKSQSLSHNNSVINAGNDFTSTSENDTTVKGANITAENTVDMTVGNNLLVESEQNTSKSNGLGLNFSVSAGAGGGGGSLGLNVGSSDKKWVDNQASIIGRNGVAIDVENNTKIVGAVIANENADGTDGGNLALNTGTLEYENIYDVDKARDFGVSVSASKSGSTGNTSNSDGNNQVGNPTLNYSMHDRRQTTNATVGDGTITVGGEESDGNGINRDINNAQVITKDLEVKPIEYEVDVKRTVEFTGKLTDGALDIAKSIVGEGEEKEDGTRKGFIETTVNQVGGGVINQAKEIGNGLNIIKRTSEVYADISSGAEKNMGIEGGLDNVPGSPVWVSRYIDENNGDAPPPNLWPGIKDGIGSDNPPVVGRSDDEAYTNPLLMYTVSDRAPLFEVLFYGVPGFKSAAQFHDVAMSPNENGERSATVKAVSIPPYFLINYYGATGTLIDPKTYNNK